jgi:hypothetical protein
MSAELALLPQTTAAVSPSGVDRAFPDGHQH